MPWAGLSTFARLLDDGVFSLSLQHTFVFAAVSVVLEVVLVLGIDDERARRGPPPREAHGPDRRGMRCADGGRGALRPHPLDRA